MARHMLFIVGLLCLWCWSDMTGTVDGQGVWYGMTVTCDDRTTVYFDGVDQSAPRSELDAWNIVSQLSVPADTRVIGIDCFNGGGPGGIVATFSNGMITDDSWYCSPSHFDGWSEPSFAMDPASWQPATEIGRYGAWPWYSIPGMTGTPMWIWTADYGSRGDRHVYCRKEPLPQQGTLTYGDNIEYRSTIGGWYNTDRPLHPTCVVAVNIVTDDPSAYLVTAESYKGGMDGVHYGTYKASITASDSIRIGGIQSNVYRLCLEVKCPILHYGHWVDQPADAEDIPTYVRVYYEHLYGPPHCVRRSQPDILGWGQSSDSFKYVEYLRTSNQAVELTITDPFWYQRNNKTEGGNDGFAYSYYTRYADRSLFATLEGFCYSYYRNDYPYGWAENAVATFDCSSGQYPMPWEGRCP